MFGFKRDLNIPCRRSKSGISLPKERRKRIGFPWKKRTNRFPGEEPVGKSMRTYAIPCIISLLVGALSDILTFCIALYLIIRTL